MSQTKPGRYQRSSGGLVGAMIITVLAVLAFTAFRAVFRDNEATPVRSVDWQASVKVARAEKELFVLAPATLPSGWRATSATYSPGASPSWHLGTLTDREKYVGVEEGRSSVKDLVEQHVDAQAERGKDVTIAGQTWQSWSDAGGDYAVARSARSTGGAVESWIVVGTAPENEIRDFAASLQGAPGDAQGS
jgi:hypothetical protein